MGEVAEFATSRLLLRQYHFHLISRSFCYCQIIMSMLFDSTGNLVFIFHDWWERHRPTSLCCSTPRSRLLGHARVNRLSTPSICRGTQEPVWDTFSTQHLIKGWWLTSSVQTGNVFPIRSTVLHVHTKSNQQTFFSWTTQRCLSVTELSSCSHKD